VSQIEGGTGSCISRSAVLSRRASALVEVSEPEENEEQGAKEWWSSVRPVLAATATFSSVEAQTFHFAFPGVGVITYVTPST